MQSKGSFALFRRVVFCIRFTIQEFFFISDILTLFQGFQMTRQIAVGNAQQVFESLEIQVLVHDQSRHDPHTDLVLKRFVELF